MFSSIGTNAEAVFSHEMYTLYPSNSVLFQTMTMPKDNAILIARPPDA